MSTRGIKSSAKQVLAVIMAFIMIMGTVSVTGSAQIVSKLTEQNALKSVITPRSDPLVASDKTMIVFDTANLDFKGDPYIKTWTDSDESGSYEKMTKSGNGSKYYVDLSSSQMLDGNMCFHLYYSDAVTYYFKNTDNFTDVYAYMWRASDNKENAAFPGEKISKVKLDSHGDLYKFSFPADAGYTGLVLSNGTNTAQTVDIDISAESGLKSGACINLNGMENGKYIIASSDEYASESDQYGSLFPDNIPSARMIKGCQIVIRYDHDILIVEKMTPLSINKISLIDVMGNNITDKAFSGSEYQFQTDIQGGCSSEYKTTYSLIEDGKTSWTPSADGTYNLTVTVSDGFQSISYVKNILVNSALHIPEYTLTVNSDKDIFINEGATLSVPVTISSDGALSYLGQEISDYSYIVSCGVAGLDIVTSNTSCSFAMKGNELYQGDREFTVRIMYKLGTETTVTDPVVRKSVHVSVPSISMDAPEGYFSEDTTVTIKTQDITEAYYKIVDQSEVVTSTDTADYTKAQMNNGSFDAVLTVAGNSDKKIVVIGVFGDNQKTKKEFSFYSDSGMPKIEDLKVDSANADLIRILSLGIFSREPIIISVSATDDKSGMSEINLYKKTGEENGEPVLELYLKGENFAANGQNLLNATASFEIPADAKEYIYVQVKDNAGNEAFYEIDSVIFNSEPVPTENYVVIENSLPVLEFSVPEAPTYSTGGNTYSGDVDVTVNMSDAESGISSYKISINDVTIKEESNIYTENNGRKTTTDSKSVKISTADAERNEDGAYSVVVEITDNAGNTTTDAISLYIDVDAPLIKSYSIKSMGSNPLSTNNLFDFGLLFNQTLQLTIVAEDNARTAGIDCIELSETKNIRQIGSSAQTMENGKAVFTSVYEIDVPFNGSLRANVVDYAGNSMKTVVPTGAPITIILPDGNSQNFSYQNNFDFSNYVINLSDSCAAVVLITPEHGAVYTTSDKRWFSGNTKMEVSVTDIFSGTVGINNSSVSINGKPLDITPTKNLKNNIVESLVYNINTSMNQNPGTDGKYVVKGEAIDNLGNKNSMEYVAYIDTTKPQISGFKIAAKGSNGSSDAPVAEVTDYGYFFKGDALVTVTADDILEDAEKAAGVAGICYTLEDINGNKKTETIYDRNATFTVEAGFKGQISAYPIDNVGNKGETKHPMGLITENSTLHAKTSALTLTPDSTSAKDPSGIKLYKDDTNVKLVAEDTYSGIKSVSYYVESPYDTSRNTSGTLNVNNGSLSDSSWTVGKTDRNLVTKVSKTIKVSNNSNNITVRLVLTDNADNTSEKKINISIDKTNPVVEISFDGTRAINGNYYDSSRTATFKVYERNMTLSNINSYISSLIKTENGGSVPAISWSYNASNGNPDNNVYTGTAVFSADGRYTVGIKATDMVGNVGTAQNKDSFVIDKTAPKITISDVNRYNNASTSVLVTINEANFNASDAASSIRISAAGPNNTSVATPYVGSWSTSGNIHTATITFSTDGDYSIAVDYTDIAGNSATASNETFTVDRTAPKISVVGIKNESANNDETISFYVDITDFNYADAKLMLSGLCREDAKYSNVSVNYDEVKNITNGYRFIWNNIKTGGDGIYTFTCTATDKAGNKTTAVRNKASDDDNDESLVFSVNRDGSTYELAESVTEFNGTWVTAAKPIELTEINADPIDLKKVSVRIINKSTATESVLKTPGDGFTVELVSSDGKWYEYKYTIFADNFDADGYYDIEVISVDKTEKTTSTKNNAYGENVISYGLDRNDPTIDISGISDGPYDEVSRDATVTVTDISLSSVVVKLNGKIVDEWTAEIDGDRYTGTVKIDESALEQTITVEATDAAGNTSESTQKVLVSSNKFTIWAYNAKNFISANTVLFWCIIIGTVVLAGGLIFLIVIKKKKSGKAKK